LVRGPKGLGAFHEYGQLSLPLEYEEIKTYANLLLGRKGNDYWVFERGKGKITPLGTADQAILTHHGMVILKKGESYFLPLSKTPQREYQLLAENEGNFLLAKESTGFGLINREGNYVLEPVVDQLEHTQGDDFYGHDENHYILVKGDEVRAQVSYNSYHQITKEGDLMLEYIHGKLRRVIKKDGILLDAIGMESVVLVGKELYNVRFRDNKLGLLGANGWLVQPNSDAEWIGAGSEGLFPAKKNGKAGFVSASGQWMIAPQFTEVGLFSEGLTAYRTLSTWGLINSGGNIISESRWEEIQAFSEGLAIARYKNALFLIRSDGEPVTNSGYDRITRVQGGFFLVEFGGRKGILDPKGSILLPLEYEEVKAVGDHLFSVTKNGKEGLITTEGNELLPLTFQQIQLDWSGQKVLAKEIPVEVPLTDESTSKKRKKGAKSPQ
jgi:hypothetical protein